MENKDKIVVDWIKEATLEMRNMRDQNAKDHKEIMTEVRNNREEFVIFKTKVNARTTIISGSIGFIALVLSIILNFGSIKERREANFTRPEPTEITTEDNGIPQGR